MPDSKLEQLTENAIGLLMKGDPAGSTQLFQEILTKDPTIALAWNNRGLALMNLGHPFDGVLNIDKAIELEPNVPEYYNNRGAALFDLGQPEEAVKAYWAALQINPNFSHSLMNTGNALKYLNKLDEALPFYRKAVVADPNHVDAHLNLSFAELAAGNYEEGWKQFEWRWQTDQMPARGLPIPEWDGESLEGKTIIIYAEQGLGDALQFMRYAPLVKANYGGTVLIEVRSPLTRLAKSLKGIDGVLTYGEKVPDGVDYVVPMMSLPRIMGTTVETIPWGGPYLSADKHRVAIWENKLDEIFPKGPKVGICWAGMSRTSRPAAEAVDRRRSTTLNSFGPLALVPGVNWISLQKGPPTEQVQRPPRGMTIADWTDELDDFYDTAALIECLDLVISVDTSVLHLAAAMGKPTWLLSRWDGCWRWLGDRQDSPWYPTLRQFVQTKPHDWVGIMEEAANELRARMRPKKAA